MADPSPASKSRKATRTSRSSKADDSTSVVDDAKEVASKVSQDAASYASDVKDKAVSYAESQKDSVAEEGLNVASALRRAADEMRSGSPQERTLGQIADGIADASDAIRNKDMSQIVGDLNGFARRNPAVFLGAAALLGFAAVRFAKASNEGGVRADQTGSDTAPTPAASRHSEAQGSTPMAGRARTQGDRT